MNKTTRIKAAQAPRVVAVDLTDQMNGTSQSFRLPFKVYNQMTHYLLFNSTEYRNSASRLCYSISNDGRTLTTYFDTAPVPGKHRSLQLIVQDNAEGSDLGDEIYVDGERVYVIDIKSKDGIVTEIAGKSLGFNEVEEKIDTEVEERKAAIKDEADAREYQDTILQRNIDTESKERQAEDRRLRDDLESGLETEATAREDADKDLQSQIDAVVAASDVKDVVGTHAELEAYDKSTLGDNDIIKVLSDETEDGATVYYRYSKGDNDFKPIGEVGPYYTKAETDAKIEESEGKVSFATGEKLSEVGVAKEAGGSDESLMTQRAITGMLYQDPDNFSFATVQIGRGVQNTARQNVVIGTGASTTDGANTTVVGYTATGGQAGTSIGANAHTGTHSVAVGQGAGSTDHAFSTAVGFQASNTNGYSTAVGYRAKAGAWCTAIGLEAETANNYSVALGAHAKATRQGEVNIGSTNASHGYKNTNTRILGGIHPGEDDHDAVTVGQMNEALASVGVIELTGTQDDPAIITEHPWGIYYMEAGNYYKLGNDPKTNPSVFNRGGWFIWLPGGGTMNDNNKYGYGQLINMASSSTSGSTGNVPTVRMSFMVQAEPNGPWKQSTNGLAMTTNMLVTSRNAGINYDSGSYPASAKYVYDLWKEFDQFKTEYLAEQTRIAAALSELTEGIGINDSKINGVLEVLNTGDGAEER